MTHAKNVRIFGILARDSSRAVLFRRGPSKRVLVLAWNTEENTFEEGQWLKGRIYERRCDLSPSGDFLIYFAANYRRPYRSWTAISRPPFLTALALWPKGDAWGGGGQFATSDRILLNHREAEMKLADGFALPRGLKVQPFGDHSGWGEDNPLWATLLIRNGWRPISEGVVAREDLDAKVSIELDPPEIWERAHPALPHRYALTMTIAGLSERDGPWYVCEHTVKDHRGDDLHPLGRTDWADWAKSGDLVFAKDGCIYRVSFQKETLRNLEEPELIADLSGLSFRERKAPPEALQWTPPQAANNPH